MANNTSIVLVPYGGEESFEDIGIFIGTLTGVELIGLLWAYFVLKYSLRRASFMADIFGGFYDMIITWITWIAMARASSIGGICPSVYEEDDRDSGDLWHARGVLHLAEIIIAILFVMDVVGLKTIYYALSAALDVVETKLEEEESSDSVAPSKNPSSQQEAGDETLVEVKAGCDSFQGLITNGWNKTFAFVNVVVEKRRQRGTFVSRFLYALTDVLVPLAGIANSAMYPAAGDMINAQAIEKGPCIVGFDSVGLLPAVIAMSGWGLVLVLLMGLGNFAMFCIPCINHVRSSGSGPKLLLVLLLVSSVLILGSATVAGIVALAQTAASTAAGVPSLSFRFSHFSFLSTVSLRPFSAHGLLVVRTIRVTFVALLAIVRHSTPWLKTGNTFYNSGQHPRCDSLINVAEGVTAVIGWVALKIGEFLFILLCIVLVVAYGIGFIIVAILTVTTTTL